MMIPIDPIMALVVVVGVFAYYALKGNGISSKKEERPTCDIYREIGETSPEYSSYQKWFEEHQK